MNTQKNKMGTIEDLKAMQKNYPISYEDTQKLWDKMNNKVPMPSFWKKQKD